MSVRAFATALAVLALAPGPAAAWGNEGHKVVAAIAQGYLTPAVRAKVEALLATDTSNLTPHDMLSEATWADAWRSAGHRETAQWHFVNIEIQHPDAESACFGDPPASAPASAGPAQACVIDRISAFLKELADPATPQPERLLALKYLLHFVGDLHQPLHAADNDDHGGNCVLLSLGGPRTTNLHSYWDTATVTALGADPLVLAASLKAKIKSRDATKWRKGDPLAWAEESHAVAKAVAYWPGAPAGCPRDPVPVALPAGYDAAAQKAAALQLQRAGVRLALVLNQALAGS